MITVFTPTYNRAYILPELFESLMNQTNYDFEWLVVDDGSTDNTRDLITTFDSKGKFPIKYFYKKNEGKHAAINFAALKAKGEWLFIVDSDDHLTSDAINVVEYYLKTIKNENEIIGVVGLRADANGNVWQTGKIEKKGELNDVLKKNEYIDATAIEYRFKYKISGDRAEVIKTDILKKYPFPVIDGERFMQESYLWYSLARDDYKFRWFNKIIYITEYLEDGLTYNGKQIAIKNCKSKSCVENLQQSIKQLPFKEKIKSSVNYYRYGRFAGSSWSELFWNSSNKKLSLIGILGAALTRIHE